MYTLAIKKRLYVEGHYNKMLTLQRLRIALSTPRGLGRTTHSTKRERCGCVATPAVIWVNNWERVISFKLEPGLRDAAAL